MKIIVIIGLIGVLAASMLSGGCAKPATSNPTGETGNMAVRVIPFSELALHSGPGKDIVNKVLVDKESSDARHLSLGWIRFDPGAKTDDHTREVEEVIYVVQGKTVIVADNVEYELSPRDSIFLPPGTTHRHENRGAEVLEQIFIFAPQGPEKALRDLPELK
jgi:quercetin dioxygenase-like cupin family protein